MALLLVVLHIGDTKYPWSPLILLASDELVYLSIYLLQSVPVGPCYINLLYMQSYELVYQLV